MFEDQEYIEQSLKSRQFKQSFSVKFVSTPIDNKKLNIQTNVHYTPTNLQKDNVEFEGIDEMNENGLNESFKKKKKLKKSSIPTKNANKKELELDWVEQLRKHKPIKLS